METSTYKYNAYHLCPKTTTLPPFLVCVLCLTQLAAIFSHKGIWTEREGERGRDGEGE